MTAEIITPSVYLSLNNIPFPFLLLIPIPSLPWRGHLTILQLASTCLDVVQGQVAHLVFKTVEIHCYGTAMSSVKYTRREQSDPGRNPKDLEVSGIDYPQLPLLVIVAADVAPRGHVMIRRIYYVKRHNKIGSFLMVFGCLLLLIPTCNQYRTDCKEVVFIGVLIITGCYGVFYHENNAVNCSVD